MARPSLMEIPKGPTIAVFADPAGNKIGLRKGLASRILRAGECVNVVQGYALSGSGLDKMIGCTFTAKTSRLQTLAP